MTATYDSIATTTLGSAASSITFSSIPGTYTDLRLVLVATSDSASRFGRVRFNGDTGVNYSQTILSGNGSSALSSSFGSSSILCSNEVLLSTTQPSLIALDIFTYAGSTNKTSLLQFNGDYNGSGGVERMVALWRNTNAITSIEVSINAGNFASGTTATLYGITKE